MTYLLDILHWPLFFLFNSTISEGEILQGIK